VTGITLQKKTMSQCHMKVTGLLCALEIGQLHVCKYEHDSQVFLWSEYDGVVSAARDHFLPTDIKQIDTFAVPYHCFSSYGLLFSFTLRSFFSGILKFN